MNKQSKNGFNTPTMFDPIEVLDKQQKTKKSKGGFK